MESYEWRYNLKYENIFYYILQEIHHKSHKYKCQKPSKSSIGALTLTNILSDDRDSDQEGIDEYIEEDD